MKDWGNRGAQFVLGDGAACVRDSCLDLVAFNPPYLRAEGTEDAAVEGGTGLEVPLEFLKGALRVVKPGGMVVFLLSDDAKLGDFEAECSKAGRALRLLASRRLFFEELSVYEASPRQSDRHLLAVNR